jgi:hypothetical protein
MRAQGGSIPSRSLEEMDPRVPGLNAAAKQGMHTAAEALEKE